MVLLTWLRWYDWVLSGKGPEVPSNEIIEDDQALDDYVDDWRERLKNKPEPDSGNKKSSSTFKLG